MKLIRLRASSVRRLREIERTPNAEPWVAEVEAYVLDGGAASHRLDPLSAVLLADDDGHVLGAAVHHPASGFAGAQYISALMIDHRRRGQGLGREFFVAVLADARERSGKAYVIWTVHPQNESMIALSKSLVADKKEFGIEADSGYLIFIDP
jgi:GNAT superfamily N-acetyltransferase